MGLIPFLLVAVIAVGAGLGLVIKKNPIHGALFLVVNLGSIAVLYQSLGAEFLAWAQVIVYAGAIMVLFVVAIMVLIPGKEETGPDPRRRTRAPRCQSRRLPGDPEALETAGRRNAFGQVQQPLLRHVAVAQGGVGHGESLVVRQLPEALLEGQRRIGDTVTEARRLVAE